MKFKKKIKHWKKYPVKMTPSDPSSMGLSPLPNWNGASASGVALGGGGWFGLEFASGIFAWLKNNWNFIKRKIKKDIQRSSQTVKINKIQRNLPFLIKFNKSRTMTWIWPKWEGGMEQTNRQIYPEISKNVLHGIFDCEKAREIPEKVKTKQNIINENLTYLRTIWKHP